MISLSAKLISSWFCGLFGLEGSASSSFILQSASKHFWMWLNTCWKKIYWLIKLKLTRKVRYLLHSLLPEEGNSALLTGLDASLLTGHVTDVSEQVHRHVAIISATPLKAARAMRGPHPPPLPLLPFRSHKHRNVLHVEHVRTDTQLQHAH